MNEDDLSLQADEVEALSSIYGDEWCVVDAAGRIYCINVTDDKTPPTYKLTLQVMLPEQYPSSEPPQYQLNAPWLRGQHRLDLHSALDGVYLENLGESIIYLWVEKLRELLIEKSDSTSEPVVLQEQQSTEEEEAVEDSEGFVWDAETMEKYTRNKTVESSSSGNSEVQAPAIHSGGTISDRRSTFQPHIAAVTCKRHVDLAMETLLQNKKVANATHNIIAYRILEEGKAVVLQGCYDDGEHHAGSRMLHLLQIVDARNVLVVVSRWYGGVHLGPDRFKHINNCTRQILLDHGYISDKTPTKKGKHK